MSNRGADLAAGFDLKRLGADFYDDPFTVYRALREHEPVKRMADGGVFLTRYADVIAVYKDPKTFSSDKHEEFFPKYGESPLFEHHTTSLVFNDPPLHTRVRRLIGGALTPRHIAAMEGRLVDLVDGLLDRLAAKKEVDLITDFASAIPIEIIGNLLGVPLHEREPLRDWSLAILGALEPVLSPAVEARGNAAVSEMLGYLEGLVESRRAAPGDPETDVLTRLIRGEDSGASEAGGVSGASGASSASGVSGASGSKGRGQGESERLSAPELLHNCIFLLNAGHETTTNLIGNGLKCLLDWPAEKARLVAEPGLIRTAIEEFLRIESSNQLGNRISTVAAEVGGVALPPRTQVTLCIGAANRDPEQFVEPDRLDIARAPNRHLAFGSGIHQCVGMGLARLEGRVAIGRFIARFPNFQLAGPALRSQRARFRGHTSLPCRVEP